MELEVSCKELKMKHLPILKQLQSENYRKAYRETFRILEGEISLQPGHEYRTEKKAFPKRGLM